MPTREEVIAHIRASAARQGVNPDVAIRVAESEGGLNDVVRQSDFVRDGVREQSYGPFQLNVNGGLGNEALLKGIDPRNAAQWREAIDFALGKASSVGWSPWYGAKRVGIGNYEGIGRTGGDPNDMTPAFSPDGPSAPTTPSPAATTPDTGGDLMADFYAKQLERQNDPLSSLGTTLAAGLKTAKPSSAPITDTPAPALPQEFASALPKPVTEVAAPSVLPAPNLASVFQVAPVGQARLANLDAAGQPIVRRPYG